MATNDNSRCHFSIAPPLPLWAEERTPFKTVFCKPTFCSMLTRNRQFFLPQLCEIRRATDGLCLRAPVSRPQITIFNADNNCPANMPAPQPLVMLASSAVSTRARDGEKRGRG